MGPHGGPATREGDRRGDAGAPRKPGAGGEEEEEEDGEGEDEEEAGFEDDDDYLQVLPAFVEHSTLHGLSPDLISHG